MPAIPEALDLALQHHQAGRLQEAEALYRQILQTQPEHPEALNHLGILVHQLGQSDVAVDYILRAIALRPQVPEFRYNLGKVLQERGRPEEAQVQYREALRLNPEYADAWNNLGNVLRAQSRPEEAVASYRQALALNPAYAQAHYNLGRMLSEQDKLDEAVACYERAMQFKPDLPEAYINLGNALKDQGKLEEAVACYRHALTLEPTLAEAHGNLLFTLNYHPDRSGEEIFVAYREYDTRFGLPYRGQWHPHSNSRDAERRLKVGYVSPDFWKHSMRHFLEPLLAHHDKRVVEVYAYAEWVREDAVTERYKRYVDHWVPTQGLTDDALAARIRADGIDILVDLAGHTAKNRLSVFARKPAPVSVSFLGYGCTTGLTAIDYFLTDGVCAPPGSEPLFSEMPWRLATPGYAYRPAEGMGDISPLPALTKGYVTFGTLSRSVRINHRTIRTWSALLKRVGGARLVIDSRNFKEAAMQDALAEKFAAHGIGREQLEIGWHSPPWEVLRNMDIGLDCFPHNSGTTLFETLYMGVPFVTLQGRPSVGRLGSMILEGVGHPEWRAGTEDEYVEIAVALATDLVKLAALRAGLRDEMEASLLMDEPGFARKVETAYRDMWKRWCTG